MTKNFNILFHKMDPERQARALARAREEFESLALAELREAQQLTQVELARRLKVDQGAVSKIEHRADMYLSTLSNFIRAMGGTLQLTASFPSGEVHLVALADSKRRPATSARHPRTVRK